MAKKDKASETFLSAIKEENYQAALQTLTEFYCDRGGLGAAPKADLDALFVQLLVRHGRDYYQPFNAFRYAALLKIRESRVRSLHAAGAMKFSSLTESGAWKSLTSALKDSRFKVASVERGEVTFLLGDPTLFRFFQQKVGEAGGTAKYSQSAETVTVGLEELLQILNDVLLLVELDFERNDQASIKQWTSDTLERVVQTLGKEQIQALQGKDKGTGLAKAWRAAKELKAAWTIIVPFL